MKPNIFILFLVLMGCSPKHAERSFDSNVWRSTSDISLRGSMVYNLIDDKILNDLCFEDVIKLLGKPDKKNEDLTEISYVVDIDQALVSYDLKIEFDKEGNVTNVILLD